MILYKPSFEESLPIAEKLLASGAFPAALDRDFIADITARLAVSYVAVVGEIEEDNQGEAMQALVDSITTEPDFLCLLLERFFEAGYMQAIKDGEGK